MRQEQLDGSIAAPDGTMRQTQPITTHTQHAIASLAPLGSSEGLMMVGGDTLFSEGCCICIAMLPFFGGVVMMGLENFIKRVRGIMTGIA